MAASKERKFRQALRRLYRIVFSVDTVIHNKEAWQDLNFTFKRNLPDNLDEAADIAQKLNGIVSPETQLSVLPFVDDPKTELKRIERAKTDAMKQALKYSPSATDQDKSDADDEEEEE
jgi:SPP1 family phage portal protein